MTFVVDASLLVAALVQSNTVGIWAESVIAEGDLAAPELLMVETVNTLRRLEKSRLLSTFEARSAVSDLLRLDIELYPFAPFAERAWGLRENLTSYDAWYVSLAEALECPLATIDRKLSRSPGAACEFLLPAKGA